MNNSINLAVLSFCIFLPYFATLQAYVYDHCNRVNVVLNEIQKSIENKKGNDDDHHKIPENTFFIECSRMFHAFHS